jgi:Holliday junction resolvasome RuvABC ATP-dependent DNA helicase subunit
MIRRLSNAIFMKPNVSPARPAESPVDILHRPRPSSRICGEHSEVITKFYTASARGEALIMIFFGDRRLGKTTLAHISVHELELKVHVTLARVEHRVSCGSPNRIKRARDFIYDEIHRLIRGRRYISIRRWRVCVIDCT